MNTLREISFQTNMAVFRKLIWLLHHYLHRFLFDLLTTGIVWGFFFARTLIAFVYDAVEESFFENCGVELPEPEEFHRQRALPCKWPPMRNDRKVHVLQSSAVDKFRRQPAQFEKNRRNYAPKVILEKKHPSLSRTIDQFKKNTYSLDEHCGKNIHKEKRTSLLSTVDKFQSQHNHLEKNGQENVPMVVLEKKHYVSPLSTVDQYKGKYFRLEENSAKNVHKRKHDSRLRIKKRKLKKERKKNSMYEVKGLALKHKKKHRLATSCAIELDEYLSSKRLKVNKDVNDTTIWSRKIEGNCGGRVEEAPDYMEVEPDYMEVEPTHHWSDMLMDSVTRLMNSLSLVEHFECTNLHSYMSIDDITNITMDLNLVEQLNQINHRMDMSVDDITNLMTGLSLVEHPNYIKDMCIENITNLMKFLSLTAIRRECFCIET